MAFSGVWIASSCASTWCGLQSNGTCTKELENETWNLREERSDEVIYSMCPWVAECIVLK